MIQITATDFKVHLGKYLALAREEEIHITKNGEDIAVLSAPEKKARRKTSIWEQLTGIVPDEGLTLDDYKMERLKKHL